MLVPRIDASLGVLFPVDILDGASKKGSGKLDSFKIGLIVMLYDSEILCKRSTK